MKISFSQLAIIGTVILGFGVLMLLVLSKDKDVESKYREVVNVFDIARELSLDEAKFKQDIDSEAIHNRVADMEEDVTNRLEGAASTPAVFVNGIAYNLRTFEDIKADLELVKTEKETNSDIQFPVDMEVFIDYNCTHCNTFEDVVEQIQSELSDYATVTVKHLPFLKPSSDTYAYAAEAAKEQGKFNEFNAALFNKIHGE
jgi:protein-disulfide isomerase